LRFSGAEVPVQAPRINYASCGDVDLAYQVIGDGVGGDGRADLVVLSGPSIPIDCVDLEPSMARFHRRLASFARVIRFDLRGTGLSSHVAPEALGPEFWADDAVAVMDAAGCAQATVLAPGYASLTGLVLAAKYPDRVRNLIVLNGSARTLWAPDYPAGTDLHTANPFMTVAMELDAVEQGVDVLRFVAPTVAGDEAFRAWWDMAGNRAASPSMARAFSKVIMESDVRYALSGITSPTMVIHRSATRFVPVAHGRYLADHLPGVRYLELPGSDTLYWVGEVGSLLDEIEEFTTGFRGHHDYERVLTTIVFTDIVGSTQRAAALGDGRWRDLLDNHDAIVRRELERFGGREVNTAGDGFVATFSSPSAAIACADSLVEAVRVLGIQIRVGIHAGEVEIRSAAKAREDVAGMAVHIGARVAALADAGEVLVSSTVAEIVTGSRHRFAERGEHDLKGVPGRWRVFSLVRQN
jgi:class 3 adenylate cyclase/pimeloyl-ACP methyl ester carboxylesterase